MDKHQRRTHGWSLVARTNVLHPQHSSDDKYTHTSSPGKDAGNILSEDPVADKCDIIMEEGNAEPKVRPRQRILWSVNETLHLVRAIKEQANQSNLYENFHGQFLKILTDNPEHYHNSRTAGKLGEKWKRLKKQYEDKGYTVDSLCNHIIADYSGRIKPPVFTRTSPPSTALWTAGELRQLHELYRKHGDDWETIITVGKFSDDRSMDDLNNCWYKYFNDRHSTESGTIHEDIELCQGSDNIPARVCSLEPTTDDQKVPSPTSSPMQQQNLDEQYCPVTIGWIEPYFDVKNVEKMSFDMKWDTTARKILRYLTNDFRDNHKYCPLQFRECPTQNWKIYTRSATGKHIKIDARWSLKKVWEIQHGRLAENAQDPPPVHLVIHPAARMRMS